jgi:hypothetical protein
MTKFETLIGFLAALLVILGYVTVLIRRVWKSMRWFRKLPEEHEWLMETTKTNTDEIKNIMEIVKALVERR